jgi:hypothetical protein
VPRRLDARPDTLDFRDRMFEATLIEVPTERPLATYLRASVPILDQGQEGACTGFGLATVIHYLLRTRKVVPDRGEVSPWMLYEMARRYDEWPGERYEGSSARGAMKGWHKHGVCSNVHWTKKTAIRSGIACALRKHFVDRLAPTCASTIRTSSQCTRPSPKLACSMPRQRSMMVGTASIGTAQSSTTQKSR